MYLRIETHKVGCQKMAHTYKVASIVESESGWVEFTLDNLLDGRVLQIGGDYSDDHIGVFNGEPVTAIDMMESLDDEVRAIMSNYFEADDTPQARPEPQMPMMMGFDD